MADHGAQTNLQLYNQLVANSWSTEDLARVRTAYDFADRMFVGVRRASGKAFIAHLVGTASVVADVDGRPDVVLAALLHSVYTGGASEISRKAPSRSTIRRVAGTATEALVYEYATRPWGPGPFADASANVATFDRARRDVLLLRLANEVDERADLGTRYADKGTFLRDGDDALPPMAALADQLECPKLAATFRRLFDEERGVTVPHVLRSSTRIPTVPVSDSVMARVSRRTKVFAAQGRRLLVSVPGARAAVRGLRRRRLRSRSFAGGR
jgi:hypothetical protein